MPVPKVSVLERVDYRQNNNSSRLFGHFYTVTYDYNGEMPNFTFYGGRKQATLNFLSLSELQYGSYKFGLKRVRLHLTKQLNWNNCGKD